MLSYHGQIVTGGNGTHPVVTVPLKFVLFNVSFVYLFCKLLQLLLLFSLAKPVGIDFTTSVFHLRFKVACFIPSDK